MNARDNKTAAWLRDFLINQLEVDLAEPTLSNCERALGLVRRLIKANPKIPEGPRRLPSITTAANLVEQGKKL